MEQSAPQRNVPDARRSSVGQGSLAPEYWNHIDPLYSSGPDPVQLQQQPQQQPLGITWDHPIFTQQQQHQQPQQQQQNHLQPQQEHNQAIFSAAPQSWHQSSALAQPTMSPGPQNYAIQQQRQYQMPHYPQGQVTYNSPSLSPSNNLSYQSPYSLPNHYYQTSHVSVPETYSRPPHQNIAPRPAPNQPVPIRPNNVQRPLNHQYILPAEYPASISHNSVNFPNNYLDSNSNVSYQQTINPQFLTAPPAATQSQLEPQNEFLFYNPAASTYERSDASKNYQSYHENLGALSQVDQFTSQQLTRQQAEQTQPASVPGTVSQVVVPVSAAPGPEAPKAPQAPEVAKPEKATTPRKKKASATKPAQPKPKKTTNKAASKKEDAKSASSDSDSDSSDDSESDIEVQEEPSPLPPTRPDDPEGAAEYDALKAVWAPRNRRPNVEKIKSALVAFKDVVKSVRDEWKTQSQAMKEAENKSENDKAAELKQKVVLQRRVMDVVVRTTLEKGHPVIVEKLGEHPMAVSALYSFLLDRHQASDYDGVLTVNILKLLAKFTTMDEDVLQKTNVMKLLPRIIKKGGQPVKDLAQKILDNAAASTKRKQEGSKAASTKDESPNKTPASESINDTSRSDSLAGTKRPREGESNGLPATKRTVTPSTAKNGPSAAKPGNGNTAATKRPEGSAEAKPTTSTAAPASARPKTSIVAPKPTSLFNSLTSASKKPGTSNAARAAAAAAAAAKEKATAAAEKKDTPPPPPPPKPTLSFGDILADLSKSEESSSAKPAEDKPPETEEERQKRLRKEARRKLRVSWKPDDSLTEVRLFTHDPEEEIGPNDGLKRGVGDIKGEGRVLKLHKNLDDEDEEEEMVKEQELRKYEVPCEIDFDDFPYDDRLRNFIKRGGTQQPDSPEKEAQERREATTLMVFYTSPSDIPPSPKEPPPPAEDEPVTEEVAFGQPGDHVKAREARYLATMNPQSTSAPQTTAPPQAAMPSGQLDIIELLKHLQKTPQQQPTPPPQPVQQASMSDLERTVNIFLQQQKQQQQQQLQQQGQQAAFQMPQLPASQPTDFQNIFSILNAQKQMQQPAIFPQIPQSQPIVPPNLAAIISQLSGKGQQASQPQPQAQPQNQVYEDPERRRLREMAERDGTPDDRHSKRPKMYVDPKAKKHPKVGSVPCRYWREGKCLKGEDCTFRHDPLD